jgi:hypothetical protein
VACGSIAHSAFARSLFTWPSSLWTVCSHGVLVCPCPSSLLRRTAAILD